jgi:eukaryotic-like serine/threonine-protein kinase
VQPLSPVSDDPIGQILSGAYRVEARIDQGAMGAVFRAEHIRLKRPVAVKLMAAHLADQPGALDRFTREAEIISTLNHPNIVQVLDYNTTERGQPFLVMELLRGRPLDSVIEQHQRLDLRAALKIALQAASGLAAAHSAGIVHRDLKPANIFLVDAGDQLFAKLLDFGISKQASSAPGRPKLTGEFDILGTPEYMPPEQALGRTAAVDHRGDQYALGIILYEMLVGHTPFAADDILALLQMVIRDPPTPPSHHRSDVPPLVDEAILRALSKNPADRFPSIADFADILDLAAAEVRTSMPSPPRTSDLDALGITPTIGPSSTQRPVADEGMTDEEVAAVERRRTSWHSKDPVKATRELIDRARQELGLDSFDLALSCAESAVEIVQATNNADVKALITQNAKLLERIFWRRLGPGTSRLHVGADPITSLNLSPAQAFLMSRLEGNPTIEEALDLSPWPREQTLGQLVGLVRAGHATIRS